ncbi:MAG: RyR domain-containing protein, partial [Anaerolineales bacterium]|nr:RyR domain-containing protein [Anaerolineales bacterium]
VQERLRYGWTYGEVKNAEKKISPYLVPYQELSEETKDLDRDTIRNIPGLLGMIGMAVYVKKANITPANNNQTVTTKMPES